MKIKLFLSLPSKSLKPPPTPKKNKPQSQKDILMQNYDFLRNSYEIRQKLVLGGIWNGPKTLKGPIGLGVSYVKR